MIRARDIAIFYAVYGTLALLLLACTMPPLQNADEAVHTLRADQISHFNFMPVPLPNGAVGGMADPGIVTELQEVSALTLHRERKVTRDMYQPLPWGTPVLIGFQNAVIYPPIFYFPAAAAMRAARHFDILLPHALVVARIAMGVTTITLGTLAIALADGAAIWLFAILLLPMSMALAAAVTQDGPMLGAAALAAALCLRLRDPLVAYARPAFAILCVLLALLGMARPPYAAFCLILLTVRAPAGWRPAGIAFVLGCTAAWGAANAAYVALPHWPTGPVDPARQLHGLLRHPGHWLPLLAATWHEFGPIWRLGFIGYLGWLDVDLPAYYHHLARLFLALALGAAILAGGFARARHAFIVILAITGALAGILLIQYLTWSVAGAPTIDGVQGRYALAPALLLGAALGHRLTRTDRLATWAIAPVLLMPIVSIAVTVHALLIRYYF